MKAKSLSLTLVVTLLTGCASSYRPLVDPSVSPGRYEQDLIECRQFAGSDARAGAFALVGGVVGAGFGILSVVGTGLRNDAFRNIGAGVGAISAGLGALKGQRDIVARCMVGRGYSVLE